MFPSADDPLNSLFKSPPNFQLSDIYHHQNSTLLKHDNSTNHFFSSFPSPFFDEHELPLNQILPKNSLMNASDPHHQIHTHSDSATAKKEATKRGPAKLKGKANDDQTGVAVSPPSSGQRGIGAVPKRRAGKKDRHSKISTAQGIRDRRMRLSLQVARKFFDLQDMLGYDKASKTIEWLFSKSKKAIWDLIRSENNPQGNNFSMSDARSESFVSECEVVSGIDQENSNTEVNEGSFVPDKETPLNSKIFVKDEKKPRKTVPIPTMRESREKARARARGRTREKLMNKGVHESSSQWYKSSPNCDNMQKLGSANNNPFEAESSSINQERVSPYGAHHDYNTTSTSFEQQMADVGTIEKLLGTSASSSTSCPIYDYYCSAAVSCCVDPNSSFMGFLGNWDLLNNHRVNSVTYQVSLPGNPNSSDYSVTDTPNFPFYQQ